MESPRNWIHGDETANDFISRVSIQRPSLLLPPLHRVPLRPGNVVEILGPSPSCKSEILLQAVINCILPKEWKEVHFGGLERIVMYFDLDCRFDVLRLEKALKIRIVEASPTHNAYWGSCEDSLKNDLMDAGMDSELFLACMRRFVYIRCYSNIEFLSALKTVRYQFQKRTEVLGIGIHFLLIDNIVAFYWIERACQPLLHCDNKRKTLSLQTCTEAVVQEIRNLLQMQPLLVLATKTIIFGAGTSINDAQKAPGNWSSDDMAILRTSSRDGEKLLYRDYMPSAWQSLVTHRIRMGISDKNQERCPTYESEWVHPPLNILDKFTVKERFCNLVWLLEKLSAFISRSTLDEIMERHDASSKLSSQL